MRNSYLAYSIVAALAIVLSATVFSGVAFAETKALALESADGLELHKVKVEAVTYKGKKGIKLTTTEAPAGRPQGARGQRPAGAAPGPGGARGGPRLGDDTRPMAMVKGIEFHNGVIELEIAGSPNASAGGGARGFVGVAFRMQPDWKTYDCFYLRPTNGRADDQLRRNHSAQYMSHPKYPWNRLRKENPGEYETHVDLVPGEWTKVKIEVNGDKARLYVHGNEQPTLVINDVKSGADAKGGIVLWLERSTEAHFRNLKVTQ